MGKIAAPSLLTSARRQRATTARLNPSRPAEMEPIAWRRTLGPVNRELEWDERWTHDDERTTAIPIRELWFKSEDAAPMLELAATAHVHPAYIGVALYMLALAGWKAFGRRGSSRSSKFYEDAMVALHDALGGDRVPWPSWDTNGQSNENDENRNGLSRGIEFFAFVLEDPELLEVRAVAEAIELVVGAIERSGDNVTGVPSRKMAAIVRDSIPWGPVAVQLKARGEDLGEPLWVSVIAPYVPHLRSKADVRWVWDNLRGYEAQIEQIAKEMASTGRWEEGALTPFVAAAVAR